LKGCPYVPWYHGDFLRSTAGWNLLERAAYWMLLCAQWETGVLPTDMQRLAAIAGADLPTFESVWPIVGPKFAKVRGGLVNKRMETHRTKRAEWRLRQSQGGKKGASRRWKRKGNVIELRPPKDDSRE
jgi:uncharacterized protein YdaU (DUF1376 family)